MGRKAFCVPALVSSLIACVLLLLCTISTPTTFHTSTPFNFVQASDLGNVTDLSGYANPQRNLTAIKIGSWGYCTKGAIDNSFSYCSPNNHGYNITLRSADQNNQAAYETTTIKASWTRGLVVVVVAFVVAVIGFVLSFVPHLTVMLVASLIHLLAFVLTLIAFAIQIALYIYVRNKLNDITNNISVVPGPGFYLTLISLPLLFFSALTVCCGWRKEKRGDALPSTYEPATSSSFAGRLGNKFNFRRNRDPSASQGGEKIPMQTSRQRVLDAYKSDS